MSWEVPMIYDVCTSYIHPWGTPSLLTSHVIVCDSPYIQAWGTQSQLLTRYVYCMYLPLCPSLGYAISVIDMLCILHVSLSMSKPEVSIFCY